MSIRIEDLAKTDFRSVTVAGGKRIAPTSPALDLPDEEALALAQFVKRAVMAWAPLLLTASVVPKWKCQRNQRGKPQLRKQFKRITVESAAIP
jgi:hypothetical protein